MSKPDFSAIHHVAIIVSDYQKARHFYVDILGLPILREHYRPERHDYKLDLQLKDAELELFAVQDPPNRPSFPEAAGLRHLAFKTEDIEATVAYLASEGVVCEPLRTDDFTGEKMTFFFDPDGLPLELHE
ncbi:SMU1112c/YaeR family gloxylase I-like metalloprotein [Enterococcus gilvus]|uniref:Glyoxalase n=1 Tax=Enterococcus gilvus ATCC BAA-350 TaxID=1158614 RepID=R2XPF7_9ENTE|nr:VOC family protein [Enterococcus gilvus]EOI56779.1 glyoxalase [Enterococcus gilvus ATCC BAA-350]EOW83647.1 glyoxalase [Enterococcus gilvus ATCC BAA-350]MBS5819806.1 VOC family protein [Enterococcus gilvus]